MAEPPAVWHRSHVLLRCSRPRCLTTYSWIGPFHRASPEATAQDRGLALLAAATIGWTFPDSGNVCPRPHQEAR